MSDDVTEQDRKRRHALSFGPLADVYDAVRPGYPAEVVSWLAPGRGATVVDVGAGTGKLTRLLAGCGHDVLAVDPSEEMLRRLRAASDGIATAVGTAEHLPLADGYADVVTAAQAWHWVDSATGSTEIARVLRPGGVLGLVWNFRDERVDWVRALGVAMKADGDSYTDAVDDPDVREPFAEPERLQVAWTHELSRPGLLDLVRSRSYLAVMSADEQEATLAAVGEVLDTHPQVAGAETIRLPYVTVAFRYRRP